jgi:hypothetical protein
MIDPVVEWTARHRIFGYEGDRNSGNLEDAANDETTIAARMDQAIREYMQAGNDGDIPRIAAYLHANAVHYYPNFPQIVGASTIAMHSSNNVKNDVYAVPWTGSSLIPTAASECLNLHDLMGKVGLLSVDRN